MRAIDKINKLLIDAIDNGAFPGVCYGIVTKHQYYQNALGYKSLYPGIEENNIDTLYDMASLSKVVSTTTCIMKLVEAGRLRLFSKVSQYLDDFKHQDITIWHLLTHTSGLPEGISKANELSNSQEVWEKIINLELKYEIGTKIHYSDVGFILLGKIIEVISGCSLNQFAQKNIFIPLDMNHTMYCPQDLMSCAPTENREDRIYRGMIRGVVHDEVAYALGGVAGHAGLFSTVEDCCHFLQMFLNNGVYKGQHILSSGTIEALFLDQVAEPIGISVQNEKRGLGWVKRGMNSSAGDLTSLNTILHTGFTGTNMWIDRTNEIAFVMLTNRVHPTRNNHQHLDVRPRVANLILSNLEEFK